MSVIQKFGPILTIGINLVVCGAIVYYFHKRLMSVESAFIKQNQIFSSFMIEFKRDINRSQQQAGQMYNHNANGVGANGVDANEIDPNELASPEAIAAVSKLVHVNNSKIEVSDDSESEDESSDESGESSDESENDEGEDDIKTITLSDLNIVEVDDDNDNSTVNLKYLNEVDLGMSNHEVLEDMLNSSMMSSSMLNSSMLSSSFMMMQQGGVGGGFVIINERPNSFSSSSYINNEVEDITGEVEEITDEEVLQVEEITDLVGEEKNKKIIILNNNEESSDSDSESEDEAESAITIVKTTTPPSSVLKEETSFIKKSSSNLKNKKNIVVMDMETGDMANNNNNNNAAAAASAVENTKLENMKVDDLRKIALDKNLSSKENIKKMKKGELLTLLAAAN